MHRKMVAVIRAPRQQLAHRDAAAAGRCESEASYRTLFETADDRSRPARSTAPSRA